MNLATLMNLTNVELSLILVEGSVLLSLFIMIIYFKRIMARSMGKRNSLLDPKQFSRWVKESEALCEGFTRNLEEKKEIHKRLITQLDGKIQVLQTMLVKTNPEDSPRDPIKKKDLDVQIVEMSQTGYDVSDIAQQLQLSMGEVQLALDLNNYRQSITQMEP